MLLLREPVRVYAYGVAGVILLALVFYGILTEAEAGLWAIVVGTVLGVPFAVEKARGNVSPVAKPPITKE
jgi:hypothetical protein